MDPAIEVRDLQKTYRTPFRRKKVEALRGVTFKVERGHVFGFVGPNGAGKTTTIRTLMGLIRPTSGSALILGHAIPSRAARARVGFLPESPYFYDYLTIDELCDLAGRLYGVPSAQRRKRADELIDRVGLARARTQSLKKFSKGMLQRAGLAQALMNDPDVVVLDEPTSGLDPIGRKEVRDLMVDLRKQGKTVFFSSHILTDIEAIADHVAIVARGQIQAYGPPGELVQRTILGIEVTLRMPGGEVRTETLAADADLDTFLAGERDKGAKLVSVAPRHETLEELFLRRIADADPSAAAGEGRV